MFNYATDVCILYLVIAIQGFSFCSHAPLLKHFHFPIVPSTICTLVPHIYLFK